MEASDRKILALVGGLAVVMGLYFASEYNYLLFHSLAELFTVVVACGIFMVAWNSRRFLQNNYVLFLGVAYLFVGGLDLVHILAYKGMNVFPGYDTNLPTQIWIAARYTEALSLLAAPLLIGRRLGGSRALAGYAAVSAALLWAIFGGMFPACFVEGSGLTPFKKMSEYLIAGTLLGSIYTLYRKREAFDGRVLKLIYASIIAKIASEMAFTVYASAYGSSNLMGHYLKIASFLLLYRAVIMTGLREPYNLLFRDLKSSEEKYHSLFSEMLEGFAYHRVITNKSGEPVDCVFLEVNDSFERLIGLNKEDIIGRRVTEVIPGIENDLADWIGVFGRVALTGEEARFEHHSEALGKWFSVSAYSPRKGYFGLVFSDVTERKRNEERISELALTLQTMFDNIPVGIAYLDSGYRFQNVNQYFCDLAGVEEKDLIGKTCYDTVGEHAGDPEKSGMERVCGFCRKEACFMTKEPTVIERTLGDKTIRVTTTPRADESGRVTHCLEMIEDITRQRQAEEVMNRYQEHLEELVAERTSDLVAANEELEKEISQRRKAEAQLLQSQKMEAVGQIAGGIAHDFNNRLFAIRNYAYILNTTAKDPQAAENAERILASCDKAAKLVDDLLSFGRKKEINPRPVDVVKVIGESESLLKVAAGKAMDLCLELPAEGLTVMADATMTEHVLINLVTNARDAMPEGGTVTVKAGKADPGEVPAGAFFNGGQQGLFAVISVSDTGPGLDEKTKEKIFEPFFTTKEPGKGTGLGLSMVYGTVTQQGGFVDVQSEPGKGTTLSIYLPLSR